MRTTFYTLLGVVLLVHSLAANSADDFPKPTAFESMVDFWERIYVDVSTEEGLLHDARHLAVVYETVELDRSESRSKRQARIDKRKRHWREVLRGLAAGQVASTHAERVLVRVLTTVLEHTPSPEDYRLAAERLRFQLGKSNKFKAGMVRSGAYDAAIRRILRTHGVPEDLAFLPHVESSFQAHAYSKSGAAGMWQFIPSTGRRFLTINYTVDERLSPQAAIVTAAKLLRANFEKLGTWPLAITAYNHGAAGMRRAVKKMDTEDIEVICQQYKGRYFGFASRKFYGQFLAARRVALDYESYFGPLKLAGPKAVDKLTLPFFVDAVGLGGYLNESMQSLSSLNPSLRESVWNTDRWIPRGYELTLPSGTLSGDADAWIASLPMSIRHADQRRSHYHTDSVGETLGHMSRTHGTTIASLIALNGIVNPNRIFPGQKLEMY